MIKIKFTTTCIICCLSFHALAQESTEIKSHQIREKVIKMPRYSIGDFPKKSTPISRIIILPILWDSMRLGYVQKGLEGEISVVKPSKPLTSFLQDHFDKIYKNDFKPGAAVLLWVVKDLRIAERTTFSEELSYTRFNVDAYISSDGNNYSKLSSMDTVFVYRGGADATAWHGENIEGFFKMLLLQGFAKSKEVLAAVNQGTSINEITNNITQQRRAPVLETDTYAEGVYSNFIDFLNNKPHKMPLFSI